MFVIQTDTWRKSVQNQIEMMKSDSFLPSDIVSTPDMNIFFTDEFNHCIWKLSGGGKGVCVIRKLSKGGCGAHHHSEEPEQLATSKWRNPRGICSCKERNSFLVVDAGNKALRLIRNCGYKSGSVTYLSLHTLPQEDGFEFQPQFVDFLDDQIST